MKLLSEDPQNYRDAPTEAIRRILEEVRIAVNRVFFGTRMRMKVADECSCVVVELVRSLQFNVHARPPLGCKTFHRMRNGVSRGVEQGKDTWQSMITVIVIFMSFS